MGTTALMAATMRGHAECVKELIQAGADLDIQGVHGGVTAVMLAALKGSESCVSTLVNAGATVDAAYLVTLSRKRKYCCVHVAFIASEKKYQR